MDELLVYFSDMPTVHRTGLLVGGLAFFFLFETLAPFFTQKHNWWKHTGIKLFFTLTTVLINFLMAFLLLKSADWVVANKFGVIQILDFPVWAKILIGSSHGPTR